MAVIRVETPNGVQEVEIAGNEPTPQEIKAMQQQFTLGGSGGSAPTVNVKDKTNKTGSFVSGFKGGYKFGRNPIKTVADKIGKSIDDKVDAYEKETDPKDVKQAMVKFRSITGIKNPQIAAQALANASKGEMLKPQERKDIAPLLATLAQSMDDQMGQQRILQLFRQSKSKK